MNENRTERMGFLEPFFRASNRILKNSGPEAATAIVVGLATIIAMVTSLVSHLSVSYISFHVFGFDTGTYPPWATMVESGLVAIITAWPIVAYCMGLVRRLRETKYALKRAAAAAEAANNAKSEFLANMSHEIRTPLNGVLGMADVLSQEPLLPRQADCVNTIRESGKTLMAILNDVLDLSKIEAGKLDISPVDANLHDVFYSIQKLFMPRAEEVGITLTLRIGESVPKRLRFDTVRVRQCLSNLVSNAVKFTETGGVTISASRVTGIDGAHLVTVNITDSGIGMSEEVIGRLFADFAQADASMSRKFGGSGLGLAISRRLARLMGGDVTVKSTAGEGSVFSFSFRAAPARYAAAPRETSTSPPRPGGDLVLEGLRILLVDDNAVNRKVARMLLKPTRVTIVEAEHGMQALELLAAQPFDLVLLDVHMPVMDGVTTVQHIRASSERWSTVPVVALTADAMSGDRERLLAIGMSGYASKPVEQRALIAEIMRVHFIETEAERARAIAVQ